MTKQEILQNVYTKLRFTGAVRSRQDFAEKIGYNYSCTSAAFNGAERYLTDRFFTRILRAFPQVRDSYIRTGEGDVLNCSLENQVKRTGIYPYTDEQDIQNPSTVYDSEIKSLMAALLEQQAITKREQEQTAKALEQIDKLIDIIRKLSNPERG